MVTAGKETVPAARPLIVVVDGKPRVLAAFRRAVEGKSYAVRATTRPGEALKWIDTVDVDLLVSGEELPEMSGSELLRRVRRSSPSTRRAILRTANGSRRPGRTRSDDPVDLKIEEPIKEKVLMAKLKGLLEPRNAEGGEADTAPRRGRIARLERKLKESQGEVARLQSLIDRDAEQRHRMLRGLRESEIRFSRLFNTNIIGIFIADLGGRIREANDAFLAMLGYDRKDLLAGWLLWDVLTLPEHRARDARAVAQLRERGEAETWEKSFRRKDGREVPVLVGAALLAKTEDLCVWFALDQTMQKRAAREQEEARAQLVENQKIQSLGRLAAGLAHEINNPIGCILSNLESLQGYGREMDQLVGKFLEGPGREEAGRVWREAEGAFLLQDTAAAIRESLGCAARIRDIVESMREYSHPEEGPMRPRDLNECVREALNICGSSLKYRADVRVEWGPSPMISCHPHRISQVIVNLLVNAADVMQDRGRIDVTTGIENGCGFVRVRDSGAGIAPEDLRRLFEPFFTTKPVGKGVGLGLHVARKIVEAHGGRLGVRTTQDKGSVFTIWIPLLSGEETGK